MEWDRAYRFIVEIDPVIGVVGAVVAVVAGICSWLAWRKVRSALMDMRPANGNRVAQLIMKARTMKAAECLLHDFESAPVAAGQLEVYAAHGLRHWRHERDGGVLMLAEANEMAVEGGHGSTDDFAAAVKRLDAEFPERWTLKLARKLRERKERRDMARESNA